MNWMKNATAGLLTALSLCVAPTVALAQPFPSKPVNLMVPYPAGGLSDVIARIVERPLGKALNQMVIVENLGGVGGAIGAQKVLQRPLMASTCTKARTTS